MVGGFLHGMAWEANFRNSLLSAGPQRRMLGLSVMAYLDALVGG